MGLIAVTPYVIARGTPALLSDVGGVIPGAKMAPTLGQAEVRRSVAFSRSFPN